MKKQAADILRAGCEILDPVLRAYDFVLGEISSGRGSGGPYASASYVNGDRRLELHFRFSLGLVTYHFRHLEIGHEALMRAVTGDRGANKYPGFSSDPLDAFRGLAHDLEHFGASFLSGDFETFSRCATTAGKQPSGFARIP